ncbi:trypsin-like serine peptidase [Streptacidiphilus monticola]|uniref:Trypsin-like serine peptidase n=1 Tax=Streptacidiphilus monticola TaxID=2161674 RepID=A0ABW1G6A3_9ACTN
MTIRSLFTAGALALAATVAVATAVPASASTSFQGTPRVGPLFSPSRPDHHFCTASVVDSPNGNLLVTAAHCVVQAGSGRARAGLTFAPGFHDGVRPYGTWAVSAVVADNRWLRHGDPAYDVAFLTVRPLRGAHGRIQDAVGGDRVAVDPAAGSRVTAVGYPTSRNRPVRCTARDRAFGAHQLRLDCPGLPGGTSGGPFLEGATIVGVIGGYQEGGATADVSYSSYFGPAIQAVYRAARRLR